MHDETLALLKTKGGCDRFSTKNDFLSLFASVRVETHFPLKSPITKSLFSLFAEVVMSCVTENRDVSSVNNFVLEDRSPDKSFMYIKNNNGPKMEP